MSSIFGKPPRVVVNYDAHPGQEEISDIIRERVNAGLAPAIIEIICGRGWGKTLYLACEILCPYLDKYPNCRVMWVAPTTLHCMSPIDDVFKGTNEVSGERYVPEYDHNDNRVWEFVSTKSGPVLKWWNGSVVYFRSAAAPESIVSKGFNLIIIDEAALIEEKVFTQQIIGTARKAGITIFIITTPRGKGHWTYRMFVKGQDANDKLHISFQQPYTRNPYYNKTQAELLKSLPEWLYRQEYLAEFIEDGSSVFKGIHTVVVGDRITFPDQTQMWSTAITDITIKGYDGEYILKTEDRRFVVGLDLAKSVDYTVLWVMDLDTGKTVYYRRFNKTDYKEVLKIAAEVCTKFNNAELIFDATGVGSGLSDMMINYGITANPYVFTNESKNDLINTLALSIEHQEIEIPNIQTVVNEMSIYTYTLTRTNKISYNAPAGSHDDIVCALALANWYRKNNNATGDIGVIDEVLAANDSGYSNNSFEQYIMNDND